MTQAVRSAQTQTNWTAGNRRRGLAFFIVSTTVDTGSGGGFFTFSATMDEPS